ncbi:MAG TPA: DUF2141 domain-containing protein [Alphaproteobacteria bacterium]|nr:DUF2141 domain-containing protein [Alphaproteobacteria bacterium]
MKHGKLSRFAWSAVGTVFTVSAAISFAAVPKPSAADVTDTPQKPLTADQKIEKEAHCPPGHDAYALVTVDGLKDDKGDLIVEAYPDNKKDFLVNRLGRTDVHKPGDDPTVCVELPGPGRYAIVVHHDRDGDNSFDLFKDGFGFSNNPHIGFSTPDVSEVAINVTKQITRLTIDMHYLFSSNKHRMRMRGGRPR